MKAIKKSSWIKLNEDYKSEINGQKYVLGYNENTNSTILEPITIINDMKKEKTLNEKWDELPKNTKLFWEAGGRGGIQGWIKHKNKRYESKNN